MSFTISMQLYLVQWNALWKYEKNFRHKVEMKKVAIYGAGVLRRNLYKELSGTEVEVEYFIDKKVEGELFQKRYTDQTIRI